MNQTQKEEIKQERTTFQKIWWIIPTVTIFFWILFVYSTDGGFLIDSLRTFLGYPLAIIFPLFLIMLYFLPSYIAWAKKKKSFTSIFIINLLLGWSFIAWVIALAWAVHPDY